MTLIPSFIFLHLPRVIEGKLQWSALRALVERKCMSKRLD
jgi:hypothetical protein